MTYSAKVTHALATVDNYEEGQTDENHLKDYDLQFSGHSIKEVLEKIANAHFLKVKDLQLDACEEKGRIDLSIMENEEGETPTLGQVEQWKKGKIKLWCVNITYNLTHCKTVSAVDNVATALKRLLDCPDLNLDELEQETIAAIENAENALLLHKRS